MLIYRVCTALILIAVALWLVFIPNDRVFFIATLVVLAWMAWEWTYITACKQVVLRILIILGYLVCYIGLQSCPKVYLFMFAIIWWLIGLCLVIAYNRRQYNPWFKHKLLLILMGLIIIVPTAIAIVTLRDYFMHSPVILLYGMSLIWVADSAAYFVGRYIGHHALASRVSPKKTIEGLVGGMSFSLLYAIVWAFIWQLPIKQAVLFVSLSFVCAAASVIGDLFVSMIKRCAQVKDSGRLLPGHGGIFDRLDGICAAMPLLVFGLMGLYL